MKIGEYRKETARMAIEFEKMAEGGRSGEDIYDLFERVDSRLIDEKLWEAFGLGEDDEVPQSPNRIIIPKFTIKG